MNPNQIATLTPFIMGSKMTISSSIWKLNELLGVGRVPEGEK